MNWKDGPAVGLSIFVVLMALLLGGWYVAANDLAMQKFFAPRREAVRRETFEESKSYNQGMIQELQDMQFEYVKAEPEAKAALADVILHRVADYDVDKLPDNLREFVEELRKERTGN